jgi:hypothetical protein
MYRNFVFFLGLFLFFVCHDAMAVQHTADLKAVAKTKPKAVSNPVAPLSAKVPEGPHILPFIHVDGDIRAYYFDREYSNDALNTQDAFSLGGKINLLTDAFLNGFRIGGTLYFAQPLGMNSKDPARVDNTLPGSPVTVLGQAFLQFDNKYWLGRIGDQIIETPWVNQADTRMIPATYQGLYINLTPTPELIFTGMRLIRYKTRVASSFTQTNLYNPVNFGFQIGALGDKKDIGTLAFGAQFTRGGLVAQAWQYGFYNFSNLAYGDISYRWDNPSPVKPLAGVQAGVQWDNGSKVLQSIGAGRTEGSVYGVMMGAEIANGKIILSYDAIPQHNGAYRNGDIISPYTASYEADPFYTTSMIAGLIEKAAGNATKIKVQYAFFQKQLLLLGSYAQYNTRPFLAGTDETDFDAMYLPNGKFKNLSIRYRVGFLNGNIRTDHFVYNRLMLQYTFD